MTFFFTYLLRCSDGTWYTGWTVNLEKRLAAHNNGTASRYTRSRRPVELLRFWSWPTRKEAMSAEVAVKQLTRNAKAALLDGTQELISLDGKVFIQRIAITASTSQNTQAETNST